MPGKDLDAVAEPRESPMQRAVQALGALGARDREVGPRDVADEQRVARQEDPGLVAALEIRDRDAAVLGPVARCVQDVQCDVPEDDPVAVDDRPRLVLGPPERMGRDPHAALGRKHPVPRDVVGVRVRLDHPDELQAVLEAHVEDGLHMKRRIDHDRLSDVVATDDIRGAAEIAGQDLLEDHRVRILPRRAVE